MGIIQATTHYQPKPHARYKIAQDQLLVDQQIDLKQALKGGKVLIETLFGLRNLKIPPGTMAGDILQIKKHGHLKPLLVRISQIRMPSKDELKTEKWKELGIDWAQATTEEDEEARRNQGTLHGLGRGVVSFQIPTDDGIRGKTKIE